MTGLGIAGGPAVRREVRSGYTSAILAAAEAEAGAIGGLATATAAVEVAAGWWMRGLALATVRPRSVRTRALTRPVLALIGRALCRSGEIVLDLRVEGGQLRMLPASSAYVVRGTGDRRTWIYTVTVDGPGSTETHWRRRDGVAHVQYAVDPARPWLGRAPWASAPLSARLLGGVERQLAGEASGSSGYVMPVSDPGDRGQGEGDDGAADPLTSFRRDLAAAAGKTMLAPTTLGGQGAGAMNAPEHDFRSVRFGIDPPQAIAELRRDVERSIHAASGIPPVLANHAAPGQSLREGWRTFAALTLEPIAELVAEQLSEALGVELELDMRRARAADVATLARAAGSLVQNAGMTLADAREVVGL